MQQPMHVGQGRNQPNHHNFLGTWIEEVVYFVQISPGNLDSLFLFWLSWEFFLIVPSSCGAEINQQAGRAAAAAFTLLEVLRVDHPGSDTGPWKDGCN